jgi:hypothetical protein
MDRPHDANEPEVFPGDIKVNEGGPIPLFLKLTYVGFTAYAILYFILYYAGDTGSALVQALNQATGH